MSKISQLVFEMTDGFLLGIRYQSQDKNIFWRDQWFSHFEAVSTKPCPWALLEHYANFPWERAPEKDEFQTITTALREYHAHRVDYVEGPKTEFDNGLFPFLRLVPLSLYSYSQYGIYAPKNKRAIEEALAYIKITHSSEREQVSGLLFWSLLVNIYAARLTYNVPLAHSVRKQIVTASFQAVNHYFAGYQHENVMRYFAHLFNRDLQHGTKVLEKKKRPLEAVNLKAGDYCIDMITTIFSILYFVNNPIHFTRVRMRIVAPVTLATGLLGMLNRLIFSEQPMMILTPDERRTLENFASIHTHRFVFYAEKIAEAYQNKMMSPKQYRVLMKLENARRGIYQTII
ncbi:MAG: hypothetical protein ACOX3K_05505 [Bacilli bacterium]